jgi:uncharacterized protein (TIGR00299 family) protein
MRIAILDPAAGISGDMTLGALIDAGAPRRWLEALPGRLGFPEVRVRIGREHRGSLATTRVEFLVDADGHGRHVHELVTIIRNAPVSDAVRQRAVQAMELIGEAEGRVHGLPARDVHLHEVGAVDAVLDLVGAVEGFEELGVEAIYHRPPALGSGWIESAHGRLPVPAPATAHLLEGLEVAHGGPVEGEATTPTGAALLRVLSAGEPPARWRAVRTGWGAGTRDPAAYPNALRLTLAETAAEAGDIEVLSTDVDDFNPEYLEPLREAAFAAGAVECVAWPTQGKKGRVSLRIETLAPPDRADAVAEALFRHSTTAGLRRHRVTRVTLRRREMTVELETDIRVRIKVWDGPDGARLKAEYDDVLAAATRLDRAPLAVAREAERLAHDLLENGRGSLTREE